MEAQCSMDPAIPKELQPHFNALFSKSATYPWLCHFYQKSIQQLIKTTIEDEFFSGLALVHSNSNVLRLKQLQCLKGFFEYRKRRDKLYLPLHKPFKDLDHLVKHLEDEYIRALVRGDIDKPLAYGLPSYTPELLREILTREILRYMKNEVKRLKKTMFQSHLGVVLQLEYWCDKELANLDPVYVSLELDTKRFSLLHDPQAQDLDVGLLMINGWYFLNGTDRIPLFLQYELSTFKRMWKMIRTWVHNVSEFSYEKKLIGFGLPLASIWFLMDCLYLCFLPYRFVRTMVNELTDLVKQALNSIFMSQMPVSDLNSQMAQCVQLLLVWGAYAALLWGFGLPFLPNPFAWQPELSLNTLFMIPVLFSVMVVAGGVVHTWSSWLFPDSYEVIKESANQVEKTVEKGIESLQKAHGELFDRPRPFLNAYPRHSQSPTLEDSESYKPKWKR